MAANAKILVGFFPKDYFKGQQGSIVKIIYPEKARHKA
jgi:hypothetical protein